MSGFKYTYAHLNKRDREWIDFLDEQAGMMLLEKEDTRPVYAHLWDVLADIFEEVSADERTKVFITQDRIDFFILPYRLFGKAADKQLTQWRWKWWELEEEKRLKEQLKKK